MVLSFCGFWVGLRDKSRRILYKEFYRIVGLKRKDYFWVKCVIRGGIGIKKSLGVFLVIL